MYKFLSWYGFKSQHQVQRYIWKALEEVASSGPNLPGISLSNKNTRIAMASPVLIAKLNPLKEYQHHELLLAINIIEKKKINFVRN